MTLSRVCCWLLNTEQKLLSSPVSRYRADAGHSYKLHCCWDTSVFMGQWRGSLALVLSGAGLPGARPDWGQPGYSKPNLGVAALRLSASATIWRDSNMFLQSLHATTAAAVTRSRAEADCSFKSGSASRHLNYQPYLRTADNRAQDNSG